MWSFLSFPFVVGAAIALLCASWRWLRDPPRRLCPGPRPTGARRAHPLRLLLRERCGFDLGGHALPCRCPECGREIRRLRELARSDRRLRPAGLAAVLLATAWTVHRVPILSDAAIVAMAPTTFLIEGERLLGAATPSAARAELRDRVERGGVPIESLDRFIELLIADLADDGIAGNARVAVRELHRWAGSLRPESLLDALRSSDRQQRSRAGEVVWALLGDESPPEELIRIAVDDLRDDGIVRNADAAAWRLAEHLARATPYLVVALDGSDAQQRDAAARLLMGGHADGPLRDRLLDEAMISISLARGDVPTDLAVDFLLRHAAAAGPRLRRALHGEDPRARFMAATVVGIAGDTSLMTEAVAILVDHLGDNAVQGDAFVAMRGLAGFGDAALPLLATHRATARDEQTRQCIEHVILRRTTDRSRMRIEMALPLSRVSTSGADPMTADPRSLRWPRF